MDRPRFSNVRHSLPDDSPVEPNPGTARFASRRTRVSPTSGCRFTHALALSLAAPAGERRVEPRQLQRFGYVVVHARREAFLAISVGRVCRDGNNGNTPAPAAAGFILTDLHGSFIAVEL